MLLRRRALLGAAGAATAGMLAGCGGGSAKRSTTTPRTDATATGTTTTPRATSAPPPRPHGGVARRVAPMSFAFDTFDSQKTGDASVLEVLGRTHSRLVQWDVAAGPLVPDLAASWEQVDPRTVVLRVHPGARWHDRQPVDGRTVTADDIRQHLLRGKDLAGGRLPAMQRGHELAALANVVAIDASTVRIETDGPDPFLLNTLAARAALVQAPEAVEAFENNGPQLDAGSVVGTGPFIFERAEDGTVSFSAHGAGHRPPYLDGLEIHAPGDGDRARFLSRTLDEVTVRDRRDAVAIRGAATGAVEGSRFEDAAVISTLFVGAPPWDNVELRRALSGALHRPTLAARLFGGRATASSPVPPAFPGFALADADLAGFPGYGPDAAADAKAARQRWEAAGGPALGTVVVDFPSIFDPAYSASSIVIDMLNETLGDQFRPAVETYTTISTKALAHAYGAGDAALWFGWGPPFAEPDPARPLIDAYHSRGPNFATTGFADDGADRLLDGLRAEFDAQRRRDLVREAARALLGMAGGGVLDWLVQRHEVFRWPYFDAPAPTTWPDQWRESEASLDRAAALAAGRA